MENKTLLDISTGDLIIWADHRDKEFSIGTFVIRLFTASIFTHVGIALVEDGKVSVVEALPPKVKKSGLTNRKPFYVIKKNVKPTEEDIDFLLSKIGLEYSVLQAALSKLRIYIHDDKWYCTELAQEFYNKIGYPKIPKLLLPYQLVQNALEIDGTYMFKVHT